MNIRRKFSSLGSHWRYGGLRRVVQKSLERLLFHCQPFLRPQTYLNLKASIYTGYRVNLARPNSFSEKILHSKLYGDNELAPLLADKIKVRDYVAERTSGDLLNELYWTGDDPGQIPFEQLPRSFVMKANHGAGFNLLVADKSCVDPRELQDLASQWMNSCYSELTRSYETQYDAIERKILIERYLVDAAHTHPLDFKFFCFRGEPKFVQVDIDRFGDHRRNIYTPDWQLAPFELHYHRGQGIKPPQKLDEMLDAARQLSRGLAFCRVDLYLIDDERLVFGEITLFPGGGCETFIPRQWDFQLGRLWDDAPGCRGTEDANA